MGMKSFSGVMSRMGIDLGSSQIRIYAGNKVVLSENSVAVISQADDSVAGFGVNALVRYHQEPERYKLEWPVKHGVIDDYYLTKDMLQYFMEKAMHRSVSRPSVMISIPSGTSSVVRHALTDAALHAGAQHVFLIQAAAAAVLGARLSLSLPEVQLSLVIGRDVSDCGLFSCGGIVADGAIPFGGRNIDEGIRMYLLERFHVMIGSDEAEEIKREMATMAAPIDEHVINVRGRRDEDGVEVVLTLTARELAPVLQSLMLPVIRLLKRVIRSAQPEMADDLLRNGMVLSGGSALLSGASDWMAGEIGIPVFVPDNPENVVAAGCFYALNEYRKLPGIVESGEMYYRGE